MLGYNYRLRALGSRHIDFTVPVSPSLIAEPIPSNIRSYPLPGDYLQPSSSIYRYTIYRVIITHSKLPYFHRSKGLDERILETCPTSTVAHRPFPSRRLYKRPRQPVRHLLIPPTPSLLPQPCEYTISTLGFPAVLGQLLH